MDLNVLIMGMTFSLVLLLLAFLGKRSGWAILGLFGAIVATVLTLALLNDGNLTQVSGGTTDTLAAANGNFVSDFNAISVIPISVAIGEIVVTIRRIAKI